MQRQVDIAFEIIMDKEGYTMGQVIEAMPLQTIIGLRSLANDTLEYLKLIRKIKVNVAEAVKTARDIHIVSRNYKALNEAYKTLMN